MLARYLRGLEAPVRYAALAPEHMHALQNWLRIQSAIRGFPQSHWDANSPHSGAENQAHRGVIGQGTMGGHLLADLLDRQPDPGVVGILHDHLTDEGIQRHRLGVEENYGGGSAAQQLLAHLAVMHPYYQQMAEDPEHSQLLRMFHGHTLNHPSTLEAMAGLMGQPLRGNLQRMGYGTPADEIGALQRHWQATGNPRGLDLGSVIGEGVTRPMQLANISHLARMHDEYRTPDHLFDTPNGGVRPQHDPVWNASSELGAGYGAAHVLVNIMPHLRQLSGQQPGYVYRQGAPQAQ